MTSPTHDTGQVDARLRDAVRGWLTAESQADEARCEAALSHLFHTLPQLAPPAAFADHVLARLHLAPRVPSISWSVKLLAAACVLLVSMGGALLPGVLSRIAVPGPATLYTGLVAVGRLAARAVDWMASGVGFWRLLADLGHAAAVAARTPQVAGALLASVLVGLAALYLLYSVAFAPPDRGSFYAA